MLLIVDEVATGFGRTGKTWGIQHSGVEPDMITVAKGIANGFPLAAVISTKEIADSLEKNTISTFGGNPVSCASANATIDIIKRDKLAANAKNMGRRLMNGIKKIQKQYPKTIGDVRGKGLMVGIELVKDETIKDREPDLDSTNRIKEEKKKRKKERKFLPGDLNSVCPGKIPRPGSPDEMSAPSKHVSDSMETISYGPDHRRPLRASSERPTSTHQILGQPLEGDVSSAFDIDCNEPGGPGTQTLIKTYFRSSSLTCS